MSLNKDMGDAHELFLASLFKGRQSRGSGNQWRDPIDGRNNRMTEQFAFAWDGKSTLAKSISVSRAMWEKAKEQAGGERPMLGLRFYETARPSLANQGGLDLVVVSPFDLSEMRDSVGVDPEQIKALVRWCLDEGHMTPVAARQFNKIAGVIDPGEE